MARRRRNSPSGGADDSRESQNSFSVYRVSDYTSADLFVALDLYNKMIPVEERQGTPAEIIKQLRNGRDGRARGTYEFDDYHFVAKLSSTVCGYMQLFFHPLEMFAFVGFLVVRASHSLGTQREWL